MTSNQTYDEMIIFNDLSYQKTSDLIRRNA